MTITVVIDMFMNADNMYRFTEERLVVLKELEKEDVLNAIYESAKNGNFATHYIIKFEETIGFLKSLGYCVEWVERTPKYSIAWLPDYIAERQGGG